MDPTRQQGAHLCAEVRRSRGTGCRCSSGSGSRRGSSRGTAGGGPRRSSSDVRGRPDLGGDVTDALPVELVAEDLGQVAGDLLLLGGGPVDRGAVLGADVVALAHALGRVVDLEEGLDQVGVGDLRRVVDDADGLGVAGPAAADLFVRRMGRRAAGVSDRGGPDAGDLPVDLLGSPEAAEPEQGHLVALGDLVGDDRCVEHQVPVGDGERTGVAAGQRLVGGRQRGLVAGEDRHGDSFWAPGWCLHSVQHQRGGHSFPANVTRRRLHGDRADHLHGHRLADRRSARPGLFRRRTRKRPR